MSQNRFVFSGLEELKAQLRNLPKELAVEGGHIVEEHVNGAFVAIKTAYGRQARSGNLADHVTVDFRTSSFGTRGTIRNSGKHAWLFENGSQARHTAIGANRGSMPAAHVFIPVMQRFRRGMYVSLGGMLERHGLIVTGGSRE